MLNLLPEPQTIRQGGKPFSLTFDTHIVLPERRAGELRFKPRETVHAKALMVCTCGEVMQTAARQLQQEIAAASGVTLPIVRGKHRAGDIRFVLDKAVRKGYTLEISDAGVTVSAYLDEGLLQGVQTLRQIIRQSGWCWPALTVEDEPAFAARGFYHDVTRGRIPTLAWLKELADEMCFYKLNQLQLYVEHTYLFRDMPELHSVAGTPLTAEEITELDGYCAARGIDLVPSLSTFGHLLELLRTKRFCHLCELENAAEFPSTMPNRMAHHTIDPTNPESLRLVLSMIDEYMALFRSPYFNICADETFDLGKGRNQGREERALYMDFVKALCGHVVSRGRTPMFWGDIVLKFPDALSELPEGTICLNWGYSANVPEDSTRILAQAGARQYVCPGVSGWNQWMPRIRTGYHNIRRMAEYGAKYGAEGLLNTDWGDYGHINDPRFSLPGMIMGACASWRGTLPEMDALLEQISRLTYGDASGEICAVLANMADSLVYGWWKVVRHKDHAQGALAGDWHPQLLPEETVGMAQARLHAVKMALKNCTVHLDAAHRPMMTRWLNAQEAISLWEQAYHLTLKGEKDAELADALLRWLQRYEAQWREVSKESELWRIRDVAVWYAEQLR